MAENEQVQTAVGEQPQEAAPKVEAPKAEAPTDPVAAMTAKYKGDFTELAKAKAASDSAAQRQAKEYAELRKELEALKAKAAPAAVEPPAKAEAPAEGAGDGKAPEGKEEAQEGEADERPAYLAVEDGLQAELFNGGKPSDGTVQALKQLGYSESEIGDKIAAQQIIMEGKVKKAQATVETDVKTLHEFCKSGHYSDDELKVFNKLLAKGRYSILRDIEKDYKASLSADKKVVVEHGQVSSSTSDRYNSVEEYLKEKDSPDANTRKLAEIKRLNSDTTDWHKQLFRMSNTNFRRG